jgi:hypothetical protein
VLGSSEHSNEPSGSIRGQGRLINQMSNYKLLKKYFTFWSKFMMF